MINKRIDSSTADIEFVSFARDISALGNGTDKRAVGVEIHDRAVISQRDVGPLVGRNDKRNEAAHERFAVSESGAGFDDTDQYSGRTVARSGEIGQ